MTTTTGSQTSFTFTTSWDKLMPQAQQKQDYQHLMCVVTAKITKYTWKCVPKRITLQLTIVSSSNKEFVCIYVYCYRWLERTKAVFLNEEMPVHCCWENVPKREAYSLQLATNSLQLITRNQFIMFAAQWIRRKINKKCI